MRKDPTALSYELAFKKEIPGMSVEKGLLLPENRKEGEREKAIKYQDECTFWRMAVAEVHQMSGQNPSFMKKENGERLLTDAEVKFIRLVFEDREQKEFVSEQESKLREEYPEDFKKLVDENGWLLNKQGEYVPRALLNWFSMGSIEEKKRRYLATMEVLLTTGVKEKLKEIQLGDGQAIRELVDFTMGWVDQRLKKWHKLDPSADERLAREIVRAGIILDWGHFSSTRFGWGWKYVLEEKLSKDGKKKLRVRRSKTGGGTTVATDAISATNWRDFLADNEGKPRTIGMLLSMSEDFRKKVLKERPDWVPEYLVEVAEKDKKLQEAFKELWQDEEDFVWDKETKEKLKELLWYWETPYKDSSGNPIVIPIFFPPEISSLNYWNTISLSGKRDIEKGDPSVWDDLCRGKSLSEFDWVKMGDQGLYRWMITIGQVVRYLTVMVDPETAATEGQFKDFFKTPNSMRELLKRLDLGNRDEKESKAILTIGLAPLLVAARMVDEYGIIGPIGYEQDVRTAWLEEMAWWEVQFSSMPEAYGGVKGYDKAMAKLLGFYVEIFGRIAKIATSEEVAGPQKIFDKRQKRLKNVGFETSSRNLRYPPGFDKIKK
jgi:hypothetical protein